MTHTITNEETGREFTFASEEAWGAALDWYNSTSQGDIQEYCRARGIELIEATDDPYYTTGRKLVDDWADVAMELYARGQA